MKTHNNRKYVYVRRLGFFWSILVTNEILQSSNASSREEFLFHEYLLFCNVDSSRLHLNFVACLLFVIRKYVDQSEPLTRFRTDFTLSVWNFCLSSYRAFSLRGQHLRKYIGTKGCVCIRNEFNSHRTGLGHQHGRRFIVLEHPHGCENDPKINTISAREIIQLFVK